MSSSSYDNSYNQDDDLAEGLPSKEYVSDEYSGPRKIQPDHYINSQLYRTAYAISLPSVLAGKLKAA